MVWACDMIGLISSASKIGALVLRVLVLQRPFSVALSFSQTHGVQNKTLELGVSVPSRMDISLELEERRKVLAGEESHRRQWQRQRRQR